MPSAPAILLAVVTFCVFARTLRQNFVDWDDSIHVLNNPYLNPVNGPHLLYFWTHSYCKLYVPVAYMLFSGLAVLGRVRESVVDNTNWVVDYSPAVFHAASLALHVANAALVYALVLRIVRKPWPAFGGALVFAIHPIQVEAVAWISELRGLLSAFFAFASILMYLRASVDTEGRSIPLRFPLYIASIFAFALAMLSKPSAAGLPLAIWAIDRWIIQQPAWISLKRLIPLGLICALVAVFTSHLQPLPPESAAAWWQRPLDALDACGFYLGKLVWPLRFGIDYGRTPYYVASHPLCIVYMAVPILIAWLIRRFKAIALTTGACVAGALLIPTSGLTPFYFQVMSTVSDRYVYLAMFGAAIVVAALLERVSTRPVLLTFTLFALLLAYDSSRQLRVWDNSETLFRNAVATNPATYMMRYNYGNVLKREGRYTEALAQYRGAIARQPLYLAAYVGEGNTLAALGRFEDARAAYVSALRIYPAFESARHNLAALDRSSPSLPITGLNLWS